MAIPSRGIGWGTEENLLWQISKQIERLTQVTGNSGSQPLSQTLAQTLVIGNNTGGNNILLNSTDAIQLENNSSLRKGTYDFGQGGGVSRICGVDYEDMWQGGIRHVFDSNGFIRNSTNGFNIIPNSSFDNTLRFKIGSFWTLDDGTTYECTDATTGAAVWQLYSTPPKYKVFTALLTQSGGDNFQSQSSGTFNVGVTYMIDIYHAGDDFSNIGGPAAGLEKAWDGYFFIATGTTPLVYTNGSGIDHNTGAPVATVLENTIGNIWFTYQGAGAYNLNSNSLFTANKTVPNIGQDPNFDPKGNPVPICQIKNSTENEVQINSFYIESDGTGLYADNMLAFGTPIEIRVYS